MPAPKWAVHAEEIVAAKTAGDSAATLAARYRVSKGAISQVLSRLRANGLLPRAANAKVEITPEIVERLKVAALNKEPMRAVGDELGISHDTVWKAARALGIRSRNRWTPLTWDQLDPEILYRRRELGQSGRQIAMAMGIPARTMQDHMVDLGVGGRPPKKERPSRQPRVKKKRVKPEPFRFSVTLPPNAPGADLWNEAAALVPLRITDTQVRRDVIQELCCAVLLGEIDRDQMARRVRYAVGRVTGSASQTGFVSLDARLQNGQSLHDFLPGNP